MQFKSLLAFVALAASSLVNAQSATTYTDPQTGIVFQRYQDTVRQASFGIALPTSPTNEFIGQLSGTVSGGWVGASFGGGMLGNLLLVAWDNGSNIVHSLRYTTAYSTPQPYTGTGPIITPICGTRVTATQWTFTFRCQNCHQWTNGGIDLAGDFAVMGWAASDTAPTTPSSASSGFGFHQGFGQFGVQLVQARNANYSTWRTCSNVGLPTSTTRPISTTSAISTTRPISTTIVISTTRPISTSTIRPISTTTSTTPIVTPTQGGALAQRWGQCGGIGWSGPTACVAPYTCRKQNDYYSQCL